MLDELLDEAEQCGVEVIEHAFKCMRLKGLYIDNVITLNPASISSLTEKTCVLAEELGHHHKSVGNILDQSDVCKRKQELRGREWGYARLVPLSSFKLAHQAGIRTRHELADFLGVTEEFLSAVIERYTQRYGLYVDMGDHFIHFDPLGITYCFKTID
ncbi:ImmA/IrrE family metallo-endopeptidase [Paenibacillus alvei]|uniref:ImmA/IrrE family metallo-endopeptidase n=1 Tax=Paenibacillus alvei TaxID=44250 RepID=UPI001F50E16D|nr:ImmA/IrrE family metallo-endopeptidase [Paenibacillus alvei]MBG9734578.1 membrane protein [Paenibacillus alvei]MBG9743111.1 membrane protein [Paenibacillus alvei]MCY9579593.1 ImmA/IrrE family metallo-endopeptidase [Paenibacillus alvei]MCY9586553.1 ImmA/IrrE family metallo-endopeptidase [Paenibacillus alvei]